MKQRAFSVVICTDGRLPFLKATIRGLEALEYRAFEVCVVCGPTEDGALAWLEGLGPRIKIARCPVRNLSRARNIGVALAAGEVVAFLDDDAIPEPEWVCDLNAAYEDPAVAAAGGLVYDRTGLALQTRFVTVDRLGYANPNWAAPAPDRNYPFSTEFPHLLGANSSFRRRILLELGGFDEEYDYFLDETDLLARVNDAGGLIAQLPRAVVHHHYAPSAIRDAGRITRHWRPLIKNRVYFGLRNGAGHLSPWEILNNAVDEVQHLARDVEHNIADGRMPPADRARFEEEALSGLADGLAAARAPRKLMRAAEAPPPFLPFPTRTPPQGRLCLALVTQDYPPGQNGGIARNVFELARAWAALGHHVHVFTRNRGAPPSLDFEDGVWVHRIEPQSGPPPPDLVPPETIPGPIWDHSRAMFDEVARLDARRRVDLIYAPLWDCEPVAFLHEPRFPLVCALQTTMDFWLDSQPERRRDPDWMRARGAPLLALERWILERAPLLHANSRAIVEDIARRYALELPAERLVFAPHGVSDWAEGAEPSRPPGEAVRFLFVGRLESRKGVDTLLAAAPGVLRRFPAARLDIVGDDSIDGGKYKADFLARDDPGDLAARVTFHGRVGEEVLRAHYRDCDVLLAPSRYESFGLVYVEGMIFGKPVIGGRAGGGPEVIEEGVTGLTVAPGDARELAEAMMRLAGDAELRRAMGEAGRRRYEERFRNDIGARELLDGVRLRIGGWNDKRGSRSQAVA